ncbi:MAG TPA: FAD-dependent monooxygenase [Blastocatellia bacterium]|nr:FAD-dependent monooxygenase [Blastocatellia bacterium]
MGGRGRRAIIIGAGPGGLTSAIALRRAGFEVAVYERAQEMREIGSGLTLWPNAMQALEKLELAEAVRAESLPSAGIAMRSWRGAPLFFAGSEKTADDPAPVYGLAIHRAELQRILLNALGEDAVRLDARCTGFRQESGKVTAQFEGGRAATGDVLIGADGIRSVIRDRLFGERPLRYAGYTVWRGVTPFPLKDGVGLTSMGRGEQFGLFPMTRGRAYWFASAIAPEGGRDWPVGRKRELLERFRGWHAPICDVIEATEEAAILRSDIYDQTPARAWSKGNVTLLGDAAHPTTPGLGQGACQAIEDGVVLANCLVEKGDVASALKAYEARRIPRTSAITTQSRRMGEMGKWRNPFACWLRNMLIRSIPENLMLQQLSRVFSFDGH